MKKTKTRWFAGIVALATLAIGAPALADCEAVKGRVVSTLVAVYSDGTPCPSPLGLCTEGRFTGDLAGKIRFSASSLTPYAVLDPTSPPDTAATTGVIALETDEICEGRIVFDDTAAFSLSADGFVVALDTVNPIESEGSCAGATGRIRISGVFQNGCVDCKYVGEICGVGDGDDDSDDDDSGDDD